MKNGHIRYPSYGGTQKEKQHHLTLQLLLVIIIIKCQSLLLLQMFLYTLGKTLQVATEYGLHRNEVRVSSAFLCLLILVLGFFSANQLEDFSVT